MRLAAKDSWTGSPAVTGGVKSRKLKALIDAQLGVSDTEVWYETPGKDFDMIGQEGGWFYRSSEAEQFNAIGLNFAEAVDFVRFIERRD